MRLPFTLLAVTALVPACGPSAAERQAAAARGRADSIARAAAESAAAPLAGMPPIDSMDVYAAAAAGMVDSVEAAGQPAVYVPLGGAGSVAVIDPRTYKVVRRFATGILPQHVVPSYDQRRLWVANDRGNSLTPIDPRTAQPGKNVTVADPYNLYFTPDGRYALVVAERLQRLDFRDPQTLALHDTVHVDCPGVDHMEFTRDGRWALATCEFSGKLLKLDVVTHKIAGYLQLDPGGLGRKGAPQDVRSAPDGRLFYVADMMAHGHARHLPEPRRQGVVRLQPRLESHVGRAAWSGQRHRARSADVAHRRDVAGARRRQSRHGQRHRRRQGAVVVGTLRRRGIRVQHGDGRADPPHQSGARTARAHGVAAARTLLAGTHGKHAVAIDFSAGRVRVVAGSRISGFAVRRRSVCLNDVRPKSSVVRLFLLGVLLCVWSVCTACRVVSHT